MCLGILEGAGFSRLVQSIPALEFLSATKGVGWWGGFPRVPPLLCTAYKRTSTVASFLRRSPHFCVATGHKKRELSNAWNTILVRASFICHKEVWLWSQHLDFSATQWWQLWCRLIKQNDDTDDDRNTTQPWHLSLGETQMFWTVLSEQGHSKCTINTNKNTKRQVI